MKFITHFKLDLALITIMINTYIYIVNNFHCHIGKIICFL